MRLGDAEKIAKKKIDETEYMRKNVEKDYQSRLNEAHNIAKQIENEASLAAQNIKEDAIAQGRNELKMANQDAQTIRDDAEAIRKKAEDEANALARETAKHNQRLRDEALQHLQMQKEKTEETINREREKQNQDLAEERVRANEDLKTWRRRQEKKFIAKKKQDLTSILHNIELVAGRRVDVYLKQKKEDALRGLPIELKALVKKIILSDNPGAGEEALQGLLTTPRGKGQKNGVYWMKLTGIWSSIAIAAILTIIYGGAIIKDALRESRAASANETFYEEKQKREREENKFVPKQDKVYKDSYVDNVIYTEGYAANALSLKYKQRWTVRLDRFLQRELDLDDRVVAKLVPEEAKFVRMVNGTVPLLTKQNYKKKIEELKIEEEKLISFLKKTLRTGRNYNEFTKFRRKFYLSYEP